MKVGDFSVAIGPDGRMHGGGEDGYVKMEHGEQYKLALRSYAPVRADARIMIDGEDMGAYRLGIGETLHLERSATDRGKFTFYKSGTDDARKAGLADVSADKLGLVQVTFRPEKLRDREEFTSGGMVLPQQTSQNSMDSIPTGPIPRTKARPTRGSRRGISGQSIGFAGNGVDFAAGGTGLSGHSDQDFSTVQNLDYDPGKEVTISLRLVCDDSPRPKVPVSEPRSNPIPEPVAS